MLFDLRGTPVFRQFGLGEAAEVIRERLREEAGVLEVCVGVSGLKVLSFVLAERAWPDGAVICPPGKEDDWLRSSPVEHLPGIRPSVMAKVSRWNPTSIRDLLPLSRGDLRKRLGRDGELLYGLLRGHLLPLSQPNQRSNPSAEVILQHDIVDRDEMVKHVKRGLDQLFHRVIGEGGVIEGLRLSIFYGDGRRNAATVGFGRRVNCADEVWPQVVEAFFELCVRRVALRSILFQGKGFGSDLRQLTLFGQEGSIPQARKNLAVKNIRNRMGFDSIQRASYFARGTSNG